MTWYGLGWSSHNRQRCYTEISRSRCCDPTSFQVEAILECGWLLFAQRTGIGLMGARELSTCWMHGMYSQDPPAYLRAVLHSQSKFLRSTRALALLCSLSKVKDFVTCVPCIKLPSVIDISICPATVLDLWQKPHGQQIQRRVERQNLGRPSFWSFDMSDFDVTVRKTCCY